MLFSLSEEQILIRDAVQRFAAERVAPRAERWDRDGTVPAQAWAGVAELGLLGALVSEDRGGAGLSAHSVALVIEELARADASLALLVAGHNVVAYLVEQFGSSSASSEHLAVLAAGTSTAAWVASREGLQFGSGDSVEGQSTWVPGVSDADLFAVPGELGQVALVRADESGVERGSRVSGLGLRAAGLGRVRFQEVRLRRLGEPAEAAGGILMSTFRGAALVGLAANALVHARAYAQERKQFGRPIAGFQAIQWKLADMATTVDASRLLVARAATAHDEGEGSGDVAARAETYAGRTAVNVAYEAIQIFGGNGFVTEYGVERAFRDAQMLRTWAGPGSRVIADALVGTG